MDMNADLHKDLIFSFMDEFSGYNQIKMHHYDAEETALRTPIGISITLS